jgi:hypothetical protein
MIRPRPSRLALRVLGTGGAIGLILSLASAALAGVANVPITQISNDPYTNTDAYHQVELEPDTYSFGSTIVSVHQTSRFTDGGSDNIGWETTTDNGATWTNGFLPGTTQYSTPPGPWARISDPSVAYDAKHNVWMIVGLAIDASVTGKAVTASRSLDGGLTWQNPVTVSQGGGGSFYDKEWITCDNTATSPFYGNCYVEWDDAFQGNQLKMSRSTNGGTTWTASSVPSASVIGGQPVVQPNGTVVMPITTSGASSFVSTNGGISYTGPFTISSITAHGASGMRDGSGLVSAEVDGGGTVYVAWNDCRFRSGCATDDIVYSTSTDGTSWSPVKRIPIAGLSSAAEFFLPGMGVDHATQGATAHLGVAFYFLTNGNCNANTCKLNAGFVSSTNGGQTWSAPFRIFGPISEKGLANAGGYFVGDYISTSFGSNGRAYPEIANATGANCVLGQITSCHEFMVAPTNGLPVAGGSRPSVTGPVYTSPGHPFVPPRTAF